MKKRMNKTRWCLWMWSADVSGFFYLRLFRLLPLPRRISVSESARSCGRKTLRSSLLKRRLSDGSGSLGFHELSRGCDPPRSQHPKAIHYALHCARERAAGSMREGSRHHHCCSHRFLFSASLFLDASATLPRRSAAALVHHPRYS